MNFENRYSRTDRLLHRFAFWSSGLQVALADFEEILDKAQLALIENDRPVFVAALPRAGTTLLLNLLVETGSFVSHTYRDMPFVLCPMIWQRFARRFQVSGEARERAHGDGMTVSMDSPEAFEEVIWKHFWPRHYKADRIEPWETCDEPEFAAFLQSHMKKIIALRRVEGAKVPRYVSKNNLNVTRLACLPKILPGATFVVPFRDPLQHASSLRKQHIGFLKTHRDDEFARIYMEGIGHYDFGANFRPVNFDGWLDAGRRSDRTGLEFWLEYWITTYRRILAQATGPVHLLSYRALSSRPADGLAWLASVTELDDSTRLTDQSAILRPPREHEVDTSMVRQEVLDAARDLYADLERHSGF